MSTVEGKKQEKRRALLDAAYELFLERGTAKTSVEDITSRAKVAKGTFYLYFQDKGAVMQALLGRVSYQLLNNACEAVERQTGLETFPDKMVAVIDHIIEALRRDTVVLKFLERNFVWPGLDQIEASRDAEPLMRKLLNVVLTSPEMAGRTEREVYQRITALGSMCMSVCYSSILEGKPDNIDNMKPVLYDIIRRALRVDELCLRLTWGEPDPADAAIHYGRAWGIVEALLAFLEANFVLKHREVSLHLDYQIERPRLFVRASLSLTAAQLLGIVLPLGWAALKTLWKHRKQTAAAGAAAHGRKGEPSNGKESSCQ